MANDFDIQYYLKLENEESKVTMLTDYLIEFTETDLETDYGKMTEENFIKFYFDNVQKIMSYYYEKYDWTFDEMMEFNRVKETNSFKGINIETALKFSKFVFYDDFHFIQYPEKYCDLQYEKTKIGYKVFEVFRDWVLRKNNPTKINKEHDILNTIREHNTQISHFLEYENAKQKAVILDRGQKVTPPPPPEEEPPLTLNQIQIVGLFKRSGIIKYLREKNPKISDAKLSKFLREITAHYLENAESVRPHLTNDTNSVKHPFYKNDSKNQYDLILNKYGISPQSDE